YPFGMFARPPSDIVRVHASSGTTGKPTIVGYTRKDIDDWAHCMARSIRAAGGDAHSVVHVAYGYGLFTGGLGAHYGAEKLGAMVIPVSGGMTTRQAQLIHDLRPDIIMVTPSYFLNIVDQYMAQGWDPRQWSLRVGIFGAEPWSGAMRDSIQAGTALNATDIYGLSEVMGPGVAQECLETQDGLTVWEDYFYPEIIDPETQQTLPDGCEGELVFTTLAKEGTPLVRYRTRDLTALLPGTARTMRRMMRIKGRSDDMMIVRGVNVYPSQIEEHILQMPELSATYQLEIARRGRLDELLIHVEMNQPGQPHQPAGKTLQQRIKDTIGISSQAVFHEPGTLPRSQGKAVRVKSPQ
ncbi:MAG: AMP-binding protein, partial [Gammaproteobacteria bacterium]|nr:AMP-binding protein [Gammaproteobacteria bacterium]